MRSDIGFQHDFLVFREIFMEPIKPSISVEYAENATIITFINEKILEDNDIAALQESVMSVIEQAERINMILDFCNVRFLSQLYLS